MKTKEQEMAEQLFKERADWQKKVKETKAQAISEFKEKLKKKLKKEFGVFDDGVLIFDIIEKTAQEIIGK
jgi:hypothetical protein